jgi:hypothetical protein
MEIIMKLHNPKTNIAYNTRTMKTGNKFVSIVERWETDAQGVPVKAHLSSREFHSTRSKAYRYATSMARYQFRAHVACDGI